MFRSWYCEGSGLQFCSRCFFMYMQTAFFFVCVFPPPAASPKIFTRLNGAGTGCATDAHKTPGMQRIVRNPFRRNECLHIFKGPMQDWVILDHLVAFIPFD